MLASFPLLKLSRSSRLSLLKSPTASPSPPPEDFTGGGNPARAELASTSSARTLDETVIQRKFMTCLQRPASRRNCHRSGRAGRAPGLGPTRRRTSVACEEWLLL